MKTININQANLKFQNILGYTPSMFLLQISICIVFYLLQFFTTYGQQRQININQLKIESQYTIDPSLNPHKTLNKLFSSTLTIVLNEENAEINDIIKKSFENYWTFNSYDFIYSNELPDYINNPDRSFLFFGYLTDKKLQRYSTSGKEGFGFAIVNSIDETIKNKLFTHEKIIYFKNNPIQ
jgi:hypothetical protein